jgi:hypothetical protein
MNNNIDDEWEEIPTPTAASSDSDWEEVPTPQTATPPEEPDTLGKVWDGAKDFVGAVASAGEGMIPGIGLIDKIGAASYATQQEVGDLFRDAPDQDTWENRYNAQVKGAPEQRQERMDKSTAGKVVGTTAGIVPNAALGGVVTKGMGLLPSIVTGAGLDGINEGFKSTDKFFDKDKAADVAETSAKWGGGIGLGLKGVEKAAPWVGKNIAKLLAIGDGDRIDRYAANPAKYNQRPVDVESVVEELSPEMRKIEQSLQDAKQVGQNKINEAKGVASQAKDVAKQAQDLYVQNLRSTTPSTKAQESLINALNSQKGKVGQLAGEQRKIVAASNAKISPDSLKSIADAKLDARKIDGVLPTADSEVSGIKQLQTLLDNVSKSPGAKKLEMNPKTLALDLVEDNATRNLSPEGLVNLRQSVDRAIEPAFNGVGGKVASPAEGTGLAIRKQINKLLDANAGSLPGYKANRAALSQESKLLSAASDELGHPDAAKVLSQIDPVKGGLKFDTLKKLDYNNGKQVMPDLAEYLAAKGKLKMPDRLNKNLGNLSQSVAAEEAAKKASLMEKLQQSKARQADNLHNAQYGDLSSDKGKMEAAVRKALFSSPTKPSVKTMESLDNLGKKSGIDTAELIDQLQVQAALGKSGPAGSRLVNLATNVVPGWLQGPAAVLGAGLDVGRGMAAKKAIDVGQAIGNSNASKTAATQITPSINEIIQQLMGKRDDK